MTDHAERFWKKVDRRSPEECWPWRATKNGEGRAMFYLEHRMHNAGRIAWALHNAQEFPAGKYACHTCDNPACVNPHHIWPGTPRENVVDAVIKGRIKVPSCARNRDITRCKWGHEFTPENTHKEPDGSRACRQCDRRRSRESYRKIKERKCVTSY